MSMFLRFVVGADDGHHRLLNGLITEASEHVLVCCR